MQARLVIEIVDHRHLGVEGAVLRQVANQGLDRLAPCLNVLAIDEDGAGGDERVLVGANGLGVPVVRALNSVNIGMGFTAGLAIVLIAIMLDRMCRVGGRSERHG